MQLAARLGKDFGMEVPVVTVYECPTIEKLAGHLSGETKTDDVRELARARAGRRVAPVRRPNLAKVTTDE